MVRLGKIKNQVVALNATYQRHPIYQKALSGLQAKVSLQSLLVDWILLPLFSAPFSDLRQRISPSF